MLNSENPYLRSVVTVRAAPRGGYASKKIIPQKHKKEENVLVFATFRRQNPLNSNKIHRNPSKFDVFF